MDKIKIDNNMIDSATSQALRLLGNRQRMKFKKMLRGDRENRSRMRRGKSNEEVSDAGNQRRGPESS